MEEFTEAPPLDDWGLVLGECAHNLRSALDNLAYALARLRRDPPDNPRKIAFPICVSKAEFAKRRRGNLDQMPAEAVSVIEALQPFQRDRPDVEGTPESDALVLLQRLNNMDKHRVPSVVLLAPQEIAHSCAVQFCSDEDAQANTPPDVTVSLDPLQPGGVILEHCTDRPIDSVTGNFQGKAVVAVRTDRGQPSLEKTLRELSYYTALIVDQFRHFFELRV
jgi:hypothetical protein